MDQANDNLWPINTINPFGEAEEDFRAFKAADDGANGKEFRFLNTNPRRPTRYRHGKRRENEQGLSELNQYLIRVSIDIAAQKRGV